jgi:hypothetical protein
MMAPPGCQGAIAYGGGGGGRGGKSWAAGTGYGGHMGGLSRKDRQAMEVGAC